MMQRSGSLLYQDCLRVGLLPRRPIPMVVVDDGRAALRDIQSKLPNLVAERAVSSSVSEEEGPAAAVVLIGQSPSAFTAPQFEDFLAANAHVLFCVIDVPADDLDEFLRLIKIFDIGRRFELSITSLRPVVTVGAETTAHRQVNYRMILTRDACTLDSEQIVSLALLLDGYGLTTHAAAMLWDRCATDPKVASLADGPYLRAAKFQGLGKVNPVSEFAAPATSQSGWRREEFPILVSIHIQTNSPQNFTTFCDRLANSCDDPTRVEVIVKIDDDHQELNELLPREVARQPFQLKYISTPLVGGFFALWESMNDMLAITDPGAYFLLNLNDEMFFTDRGWDTRLERYVGIYPDHLYRLRTSIYKTRNYHDHWECGFAPETSAVTTKRWIVTGGNWNPCLGPDTFQQCVAYYFNLINRHLPKPRFREIPIDDIRFGGEGAYIGLTGASLRRRVRGATRAWFRLMSAEIQEEAARRAAKIHATITADEHGLPPDAIHLNARRRQITVHGPSGPVASYSFAIPRRWYRRLNAARATQFADFGGGGTDARRGYFISIMGYLALRYDAAEKVRAWLYEEGPAPMSAQIGRVARARYITTRFIRDHLLHLPGYIQLFYLRSRNRVRGYLALAYYRILLRALNYIHSILVLIPRRGYNRFALFYHRDIKHVIRVCALLVRRTGILISNVTNTAWSLIAGFPRRLGGGLSLLFQRAVKPAGGLAKLIGYRAVGKVKNVALWFLVNFSRRIRGELSLFYHRRIKFAVGLAELVVRLSFGHGKVMLWHILIGFPRLVRRKLLGNGPSRKPDQ